MHKAIFAAGCFWGVEHKFMQLAGILKTQVGYIGGNLNNPSYEQVCTGTTDHAEAIEINYDPAKISYSQLLDCFFSIHDPTQLNRQGVDIGTQYRSEIFYLNKQQKQLAAEYIANHKLKKQIVTKVSEATKFYPAEEYHQKYIQKKL